MTAMTITNLTPATTTPEGTQKMNHTLTLDTLFTAHGYYGVDTAEGRHYIQTASNADGNAFSYHVHHDGLVEFELLTICTQFRHEVCNISTPEGMTTLIHELVDHKAKAAAETAAEEAAAEGRREAQDTFEQGYWEYLDGAESDFDPTFYDDEGDLLDR